MSMDDDEGHVMNIEASNVFNEARLLGEIPQYESKHIRHYFTDQVQF